MADPQPVPIPPGHVVITTTGTVTAETLLSWGEMRSYCQRIGLTNVRWNIVQKSLVDKARNDAVQQMLADPHAKWILFIDADMQWQPQALTDPDNPGRGLLDIAFAVRPDAAIVGAWCPLRGQPYLPTIDPGSGLWEPVPPGRGLIDVIRTGSAFVLVKREVFERMEPPWYGIRPTPRPIDALLEVDNFIRCHWDGENPLRLHPLWDRVEEVAIEASSTPRDPRRDFNTVGEDSNLCDRAKALGFTIIVQTDVVIAHVDKKVITYEDHIKAMQEMQEQHEIVAGVRR